MLGQLRDNLQRFKPRSASVRNVLKLAGGTAGSQVIAVAAAPLLTRLYGPESFGILATFTSILALLNVVSSLRYELAIAVPEDDDEAIALVCLCFVLVGISTALTALGVGLLGDDLVRWLQQPDLQSLLWLLPVGVLLMGVSQPLSYWAVRQRYFELLVWTKFQQIILNLIIGLATAPLGSVGLLFGLIAGQSAGFLLILRQSLGIFLKSPGSIPSAWLKILYKYYRFGFYSLPSGLINTISNQAPSLIFASVFGMANLGQLALAQRLLLLPISLIADSVSQVFMSQAAQRHRDGLLLKFVLKASKNLFLYSLIIAVLLSLVIGFISPLLIGREWNKVAVISIAMTPLVVTQASVSPLTYCFDACDKNLFELYSQIILAFARLVPLCLVTFLDRSVDFLVAVLVYCFSSSLGYIACKNILVLSIGSRRAE